MDGQVDRVFGEALEYVSPPQAQFPLQASLGTEGRGAVGRFQVG